MIVTVSQVEFQKTNKIKDEKDWRERLRNSNKSSEDKNLNSNKLNQNLNLSLSNQNQSNNLNQRKNSRNLFQTIVHKSDTSDLTENNFKKNVTT